MEHNFEVVLRCKECGFLIRQPYCVVPNVTEDQAPPCKNTPAAPRVVNLMDALRKALEHCSTAYWSCGCGQKNGLSLATCAQCGRPPGAQR